MVRQFVVASAIKVEQAKQQEVIAAVIEQAEPTEAGLLCSILEVDPSFEQVVMADSLEPIGQELLEDSVEKLEESTSLARH